MYCSNCGINNDEGARFCKSCGVAISDTERLEQETSGTPGYSHKPPVPTKNKVAAGVLAIVLGWLGIHKFYLGYITAGILLIIITVVTCGIVGPIIGLIEGILYLTKTDEEFHGAYVVNSRSWF